MPGLEHARAIISAVYQIEECLNLRSHLLGSRRNDATEIELVDGNLALDGMLCVLKDGIRGIVQRSVPEVQLKVSQLASCDEDVFVFEVECPGFKFDGKIPLLPISHEITRALRWYDITMRLAIEQVMAAQPRPSTAYKLMESVRTDLRDNLRMPVFELWAVRYFQADGSVGMSARVVGIKNCVVVVNVVQSTKLPVKPQQEVLIHNWEEV